MIQHIVMFKFQETACGKTKAENLEEARQRMLALREQIPQIRGMEVRLAAPGSAPGNYDYILISQFDSMEELVTLLKMRAEPGDVLLFKGSRGMKMEQALELFLSDIEDD